MALKNSYLTSRQRHQTLRLGNHPGELFRSWL